MIVYTHFNVDIDAMLAVWAVVRFVLHHTKFSPGTGSQSQVHIKFKSADWDGSGMTENDIAIDILAGGRGIKGDALSDNKGYGSAFAKIMYEHAPEPVREALKDMIEFVEVHDSQGGAPWKIIQPEKSRTEEERKRLNRAAEMWKRTGIVTLTKSLRSGLGDDLETVMVVGRAMDGMLKLRLEEMHVDEKERKEQTLAKTQWFGTKNRVALVYDGGYIERTILLKSGARIVVSLDHGGKSAGIVRSSKVSLRMDHPYIQAVIDAASETGWYAQPDGRSNVRGSAKAPVDTPSKVDLVALAKAAARALEEQQDSSPTVVTV